MRRLSVALIALLVLAMHCEAQTKDITKKFKNWYHDSWWTYEPDGASIDNDGVVHLSLLMDDNRTRTYQMMSKEGDRIRARKSMVCYALFYRARDVFKEFPTATEYNVWAVHYPTERDRYGNQVSTKREVIAHLRLTRETMNRINWDYLENMITQRIMSERASWTYDTPDILQMLDLYQFEPKYF